MRALRALLTCLSLGVIAVAGLTVLAGAAGATSSAVDAFRAAGAGASSEAAAGPPRGAVQASLALRRLLFAGVRPQSLQLVVPGRGETHLSVQARRLTQHGSQVVRTWDRGAVRGGSTQNVDWDGSGPGIRLPEDGRYEFTATFSTPGTPGRAVRLAAPFVFVRNFFPVRGPHSYGNGADRFGAPRWGHAHQGQDVLAACGTPLVAARGGRVKQSGYDAAGGNYVVIDAAGSGADFVYMHLRAPAVVSTGEEVVTGQHLGDVGDTGRAFGCHLHFELWTGPGWHTGGVPFDPIPRLRAWDEQTGALRLQR